MKRYHTVMTIAGSDSGGGAGIQADLKAISACGCFGTSAVTAITAQNTCGVTDIHPIPIATLEAQIRAVLDDIGADAVKLGMLHSSQVIECVAGLLAEYRIENVVLDPVMAATSGDRLIQEDAIAAMQELLFPRVRLITPNIPEAEILIGHAITGGDGIRHSAAQLGGRFQLSVLAKGGHLDQNILEDALYNHETKQVQTFKSPKIATQNSHGTGCTLSSSLAAYLARGLSLLDATEQALDYVHQAIAAGALYQIGHGHGPVHHFHAFWD
jgi:hydroxymethylpyrimidine/phosphomethylpyrimidine kinase